MILYFSGTGNSKYVANKIGEITSDISLSLNEAIKNNQVINDLKDNLVVVTPTYAWKVPNIVWEYIDKLDYSNVSNIYFVMTCGAEIGDAYKYNEEFAKKHNINYKGTLEVIMPENYIAMFNAPNEEETKEIIEKADPIIIEAANLIKENKDLNKPRHHFYYGLLSSLVNTYFYKFYVKDDKYVVSNDCINCGICEKLCPLNNIKMINGKPKWNGNCTQCMACICHCPKEAIEFGKNSVGKPRYHID